MASGGQRTARPTKLNRSRSADGTDLACGELVATRLPLCVQSRLAFTAVFCLLRYVAPAEDVSSVTASGGDADHGRAIFTTTHWSIVLEAQGESPAAQEALEKLCRTYWRPIYGYVRRQGASAEDAEDLTQGFFALALKRGKGQRLIPFDDIREAGIDAERSDSLTADQIYERRWAFAVLEQVMAQLREEYRSAGNVRFFDQMKKMLMDEPDRPSQAQVANEFAMTENAVKQAFYRFRQRYQTLLREEIAHTVAVPGDIEDELRHLIAVVRA